MYTDNGQGFEPAYEQKNGIGLANIRERVDKLRGELEPAQQLSRRLYYRNQYSIFMKPPYQSVLVIDDHKMIINGIRVTIEHLFEQFHEAYTGESGVEQALKHQPQLRDRGLSPAGYRRKYGSEGDQV